MADLRGDLAYAVRMLFKGKGMTAIAHRATRGTRWWRLARYLVATPSFSANHE